MLLLEIPDDLADQRLWLEDQLVRPEFVGAGQRIGCCPRSGSCKEFAIHQRKGNNT